MILGNKLSLVTKEKISNILFVFWAGGAALLSYALVYALRKPFTAATFEGLEFFGLDYKVATSIIQIFGYLISKFIGIKMISELKKEGRLRFMITSVAVAEISLVLFGCLPRPFNVFALFFNGLSLGCMWGVIFSFIEGRRVTDMLASLLGISMVISSGAAKSLGLFVMDHWQVSEFWMPALIGGCALPCLALLGYVLQSLPKPSEEDRALKAERMTLDGRQRWALFKNYMPFLSIILVANFLLVALRDIKEDFLVKIFDVAGSGYSSWIFAQLDSIVTLIILIIFGLMVFVRNNMRVLLILLSLVILGMLTMSFISLRYEALQLSPVVWLFIQSLCLYLAYLCFQTIFFDRFIACFRIRGNVGFFIVLIDFIGYLGTVIVLAIKEFLNPDINWLSFYNQLAGYVGLGCSVLFVGAWVYLYRRTKRRASEKVMPLETAHAY